MAPSPATAPPTSSASPERPPSERDQYATRGGEDSIESDDSDSDYIEESADDADGICDAEDDEGPLALPHSRDVLDAPPPPPPLPLPHHRSRSAMPDSHTHRGPAHTSEATADWILNDPDLQQNIRVVQDAMLRVSTPWRKKLGWFNY
jgi:hypothetical protein